MKDVVGAGQSLLRRASNCSRIHRENIMITEDDVRKISRGLSTAMAWAFSSM